MKLATSEAAPDTNFCTRQFVSDNENDSDPESVLSEDN